MNRAEVRTQFKALLNRNDCTSALADLFIDQALSRLQRTLRLPPMERALTIVFEGDAVNFPLPSDFLEFINLYIENDTFKQELTQLPLGRFLKIDKATGNAPRYYCRFGGEVAVSPAPANGTALYLHYYASFPNFTDDFSTNFVSVTTPELLIYGALSFATDYFVDDRKQGFEDTFQRTYLEIMEQARMLEFSGGEMVIQPTYGLDCDY